MDFERSIVGKIPLEMAATYFTKLKTAEVGDPPDETGELEGQFTVPVNEALQLLSAMVENEMKTMLAYKTYANSLRGLAHHSIAEEFEDHAENELEHADFLLRRMSVLGGPIHLSDVPAPIASSDPIQIVKIMVRMEQDGIAKWKMLHSICGENPMKFKVEEYMTTEQEHLDELWQLLPAEARSLDAESPAPPVQGLQPPPEGPVEADEKKEAASLNWADKKIGDAAKKVLSSTGKKPYALTLAEDRANLSGSLAKSVQKAGETQRTSKPSNRSALRAQIAEIRSIGKEKKANESFAPGHYGVDIESEPRNSIKHMRSNPLAMMGGAAGALVGARAGKELGGSKLENLMVTIPVGALIGAMGGGAVGHMAQQKISSAHDRHMADKGHERGVANSASRIESKSHRKGEDVGDLAGRLTGAAAGAAAGHRLGKDPISKTVGTLGGAALGQALAGRAGRMAGHELDKKKFEKKFKKEAVSKAWVREHAAKGVKERLKKPTEIGFGLLDKAKGHLSRAKEEPLAAHKGKREALGSAIKDTVHSVTKKAEAFKFALDQMMADPSMSAGAGLPPEAAQMLEQEQAAQAAEEQVAEQFYQQRFQEAQQQLQAAEQAKQQMQQQLEGLSQQQAASQEQIQMAQQQGQQMSQMATQTAQSANQQASQAMMQAMAAQKDLIAQQAQSTQMRMAYENFRSQLSQLAAAEPPAPMAPASSLLGAAPMTSPMDQTAMAGTPEQAGGAQAGPTTTPPGGSPAEANQANSEGPTGPSTQNPQPTSTQGQTNTPQEGTPPQSPEKVGFAMPPTEQLVGGAAGALAGAGLGMAAAGHFGGNGMASEQREKVRQMEESKDDSFFSVMRLAKAKAQLALSEGMEQHPGVAALGGGLMGAAIGRRGLPAAMNVARNAQPTIA